MGLDKFQHLADFDFVKHFGIITHTVQLDNINWKTREMLNDLSQGFEAIKCNFCDKNAVVFKIGEKIAYCEEHTEEYGISTEEVENIERITNRLKEIVENMYTYLIFVQERIHFIKLDRFEALFYTTTVDIDRLNDKLNLKINSFHTIIQTLKKSRDIKLLFDVKTSLEHIKEFACDIVNKIYDLLKDEFKESFCKSINNDCDLNYSNDYQYKEETKGEKLSHQPEDNIYEKPLNILIGDFISSLKVLNFQDEIKGLFKYSVKMTKSFEECKKELNKVQNELDSIKEESKIDEKSNEGNKLLSDKEIVIESLRSYKNPTTTNLFSDKTIEYIGRILVDFLFRFKDKHPFSKPKERKVMDVFDIVMDFMNELGFEPSKSLKEEYRECETNNRLTTFPEYEYLSSIFENDFSKEKYDFMKMRFESRPPFVFYFNPDIQLEEKFGVNKDEISVYNLGFYSKGTFIRIGAALALNERGDIDQAYYKDGKEHNYGRIILDNGDIYEGGWNMGKKHGKAEYELYESGVRGVGQWINSKAEGEFKCYDKEGNMTIIHYKDGKRVEN